MGDKLANTAAGAQLLFSSRRSDRATRDLGARPAAGARASGFPSPEAEVLSKATLMGDGQTGLWARKGREGDAFAEGESATPE